MGSQMSDSTAAVLLSASAAVSIPMRKFLDKHASRIAGLGRELQDSDVWELYRKLKGKVTFEELKVRRCMENGRRILIITGWPGTSYLPRQSYQDVSRVKHAAVIFRVAPCKLTESQSVTQRKLNATSHLSQPGRYADCAPTLHRLLIFIFIGPKKEHGQLMHLGENGSALNQSDGCSHNFDQTSDMDLDETTDMLNMGGDGDVEDDFERELELITISMRKMGRDGVSSAVRVRL